MSTIKALFLKLQFKKYMLWAFFIYLAFYGLSVIVNYIYWAMQSITHNIQAEILQHSINFQHILQGNHILDFILKAVGGHIVVVPKFFIISNLVFFQGYTLIPNLFNIFLCGVILWMVWRVVQISHWKPYTKYILLFFSMVMIFAPGNVYTMGPEHSIWHYLYVLVLIDLYLFIRIPHWAGNNKVKLILYYMIFTVFLLLTCLTFSNGILIIPTVVILFWLRRQRFLSVLYLLLGIGLVMFLKGQYNVVNHHIIFDIVRILRFGIAILAIPTLKAMKLIPYPNIPIWIYILQYFRAFIIFSAILTIFYHYVIKRILWRGENRKVLEDWQVFFLGLILFAVGGIAMLALLESSSGSSNYGLTVNFRFYLNFNMMMIGIFVFCLYYVDKVKKYYPFFIAYVVFYISAILMPYTQVYMNYIYNFNIASINTVVSNAMGGGGKNKNGDGIALFKMWDLNGYAIWQRHLMGKNIYTMRYYYSPSTYHELWFIEDPVCKACVDFYQIYFKDSGKFGIPYKNMKTMYFLMYGRFPYWFSKTVFITNEKGTIVGLGFVRIRSPKYVNIFTIVPYVQHQIKNMKGYFYYDVKLKASTYTLWAVGLDRRSIRKMFTFKVTKNLKKEDIFVH